MRRVGRHVAMMAMEVSIMDTVQVSIVSFRCEYTARTTACVRKTFPSNVRTAAKLTACNDHNEAKREHTRNAQFLLQRKLELHDHRDRKADDENVGTNVDYGAVSRCYCSGVRWIVTAYK